MPKYSRSRSRSRGDKKSHKHRHDKDKKKHKKHSRSPAGGSDSRRDSRRDRKGSDGANGSSSYNRDAPRDPREPREHRDQRDQENGGNYRQDRRPDEGNREQRRFDDGPSGSSQAAAAKRSRFSDLRKLDYDQLNLASAPSMNNQIQQQYDSRSQMPPPSDQAPVKRKKFVWTDANEDEMRAQQMKEKRSTQDDNQPALLFGSNPSLMANLNPAILNALQDSSKIKKKIYLPKNTGINYIGLLIGPRGLYQKRLEEESGCKILIRGKGSQKEGSAPQPDDDDEQHVLIIGDSTESVRRAQNAIERVISADDSTRNKIREEQLVVAQQINNSITPNQQMDDSMMTPYGPPSPYAYIIPVPNDCVGLIIGKGGDTIRQLQMESGAKIQVAKKEIPNSNLRNVFVEGPPDKYQRAKEMIDDIIKEHRRTADPQIHVGDINPFNGPSSKVKVPDKFVGLIIGKNGENLRGIAQRSNTKIFVPQKNNDPGAEERTIEVEGDSQSIEIARQEIFALIQRVYYLDDNELQYMSQSGSSVYDYQKNPYGSGIAVYNQQKLASDGQTINGAVPDSLKPESGSYASSLLTENPMLAYNAMQLTGWSYDYPNQTAEEGKSSPYSKALNSPTISIHSYQYQIATQAQSLQNQQHSEQTAYDQSYYQQYPQGQYGAYDQGQYPPEYYNQQYYAGYYQQPQPTAGVDQAAGTEQPQNPEGQTQASNGDHPQGYDQTQYPAGYDQAYYQQYYQQYYGQQPPPAGGDYNAYYQQQQQYYAGQQNPEGAPNQSLQAAATSGQPEEGNQEPAQ